MPERTATDRGERLLVVDDLTVEFPLPDGRLRAVDSVSLDLCQGESLGVVGESGAGKSVLLRSIMGLMHPEIASREGSVRFEGRELVGLPRRELRRLWGTAISVVFQDPMSSLNPVVRIGRQIGESVRPTEDGRRVDVRERSLELLRSSASPIPGVGSAGTPTSCPVACGNGWRSPSPSPAALGCCSPTSRRPRSDVTVQAQILDLLAELQDRLNMAMILVSHDLAVMATRTDRIVVMYAGQVVEHAPTRDLFRSTRMPYTEALIRSVPKLDDSRHALFHTIGGRPPDPLTRPSGCLFAPRCQYAQPRCREERPPLVEADTPGHYFRCWFPVGTDAGREALERNALAQRSVAS